MISGEIWDVPGTSWEEMTPEQRVTFHPAAGIGAHLQWDEMRRDKEMDRTNRTCERCRWFASSAARDNQLVVRMLVGSHADQCANIVLCPECYLASPKRSRWMVH